MSTRLAVRSVAIGGLAILLTLPVVARAATPITGDKPTSDKPDTEARDEARTEANLPTDGRPIVATVVDVDESAGRVTLDSVHGRIDLSVTQELAGRLTPGDVVVLRLSDEDSDKSSDTPSASPREDTAPDPRTKI